MKKFILSIIIFMMLIPFVVNAEICDTDKITISSITTESKSDNVEELDETKVNDKAINLNLSMSEVGDKINYKIVVKNDSNEDYELDKKSFNLSSNYIEYTLESEDNTNIVKANSSKVVYLKVNYVNEVPNDVFESGVYNDNKNMTINISNNDTIGNLNAIKNPNTGVQSYILTLFIILLIIISAYRLLRKRKYAKFIILIVGSVIIIPVSVCALCKCEIDINSSIVINQKKLTGTIYRWNMAPLKVGDIISVNLVDKYIIADGLKHHAQLFDSEEDCERSRTSLFYGGLPSSYTCQYKKTNIGGGGDFTFDSSEINMNYYLKHIVVNGVVTESFVCFKTDKEHCLKGGDNGEAYNSNIGVMREYQTFLNIPTDNGANPTCRYSATESVCYASSIGGYRYMTISSDGVIAIGSWDGVQCGISADSHSYCYEMPY